MRVTRRNVIIGAGTVAVGIGVAIGTGAFTTVEAERTATVDVEDDSQAYLRLLIEENSPDGGAYEDFQNQDFTSLEEGTQGQQIVQFNFDDAGGGDEGDGLNDDAVTRFDNVFMIENQSGGAIELDYRVDDQEDHDIVTLYQGDDHTTELSELELGEGDGEYVGFEFDTTESVPDFGDDDVDITIVAETQGEE